MNVDVNFRFGDIYMFQQDEAQSCFAGTSSFLVSIRFQIDLTLSYQVVRGFGYQSGGPVLVGWLTREKEKCLYQTQFYSKTLYSQTSYITASIGHLPTFYFVCHNKLSLAKLKT